MEANMPARTSQKQRNLSGVGLRSRRTVRSPAEIALDRQMRDAFVGIVGKNGTVPSRGLYDVREGRKHPWRLIARRLVEARKGQTAKERVLAVGSALMRWINDELYRDGAA